MKPDTGSTTCCVTLDMLPKTSAQISSLAMELGQVKSWGGDRHVVNPHG